MLVRSFARCGSLAIAKTIDRTRYPYLESLDRMQETSSKRVGGRATKDPHTGSKRSSEAKARDKSVTSPMIVSFVHQTIDFEKSIKRIACLLQLNIFESAYYRPAYCVIECPMRQLSKRGQGKLFMRV